MSKKATHDMETRRKNLRLAVEQDFPPYACDLGKILKDPGFENAGRVHDWRNYVPDEVRALWGQLNHNARLSIILIAEKIATNEEWE